MSELGANDSPPPSRRARSALRALALLLVAGCGGAVTSEEEIVGTQASAVVGGVPSAEGRDAVVFLRTRQPEKNAWLDCTGTLIAPRVLVTARHCVSAVQPGGFVCRGNGDLVDNGSGSGIFGATYEPGSIEVRVGARPSDEPAARGAAIVATNATSACRDDLALLILDRAVTVASYPRVRLDESTRVGERVDLVGYGLGDRTTGPVERREVRSVRIADVGTKADAGVSDDTASTPARSFVVSGNTVCYGDSGGPAFSEASGALIGVYSRITGSCFAPESRNTFMAIGSYATLVARAFALTGDALPVEVSDADASTTAGATVPAPRDDAGPALDVTEPGSPRRASCSSGAKAPRAHGLAPAALLLAVAGAALTRRRARRFACAAARSRSARGG